MIELNNLTCSVIGCSKFNMKVDVMHRHDGYKCWQPDCAVTVPHEHPGEHRHNDPAYGKCWFPDCKITELHEHVRPEFSAGKNSYRVPIKYRFDLIPPVVLQQLAEVYEEGAQNYGEAKYIEKPLPFSVVINHAINHLMLLCSGDRSELHAAKVMWAMATIINIEALQKDGLITDHISDLSAYGAKAHEALLVRDKNESK